MRHPIKNSQDKSNNKIIPLNTKQRKEVKGIGKKRNTDPEIPDKDADHDNQGRPNSPLG